MADSLNDKITYFAETDSRHNRKKFGIKADDRSKHVYVIGKTGMGKSTLLENMAVQDIQSGNGMVFIDPHGATAEKIMRLIEDERYDPDVVGMCLDLGHSNISNNPVNDLEGCSERLFAIHVSDNNSREDSHGVPFTGTIDWAQVSAVLKKIGFDGYFMYEIRNRDNIDDTLNKINESFKRISEGFENA